ncbi:MAG: hypothetical protein ACR2NK_10525 [Mariniblastus sp.]
MNEIVFLIVSILPAAGAAMFAVLVSRHRKPTALLMVSMIAFSMLICPRPSKGALEQMVFLERVVFDLQTVGFLTFLIVAVQFLPNLFNCISPKTDQSSKSIITS